MPRDLSIRPGSRRLRSQLRPRRMGRVPGCMKSERVNVAGRGFFDSGAVMAHVAGASRYQATLFPEVLDEVVGRDDPVRVIDAFVDTLDLGELGFPRLRRKKWGVRPTRQATC